MAYANSNHAMQFPQLLRVNNDISFNFITIFYFVKQNSGKAIIFIYELDDESNRLLNVSLMFYLLMQINFTS